MPSAPTSSQYFQPLPFHGSCLARGEGGPRARGPPSPTAQVVERHRSSCGFSRGAGLEGSAAAVDAGPG